MKSSTILLVGGLIIAGIAVVLDKSLMPASAAFLLSFLLAADGK